MAANGFEPLGRIESNEIACQMQGGTDGIG